MHGVALLSATALFTSCILNISVSLRTLCGATSNGVAGLRATALHYALRERKKKGYDVQEPPRFCFALFQLYGEWKSVLPEKKKSIKSQNDYLWCLLITFVL